MSSPVSVVLEVPFSDKDRVKALGARWDRHARCWYVPAGVDPTPFESWLPRQLPAMPAGPTVAAGVVFMPETCYRCGNPTMCVAGVVIDPDLGGDADGFIVFGEISDYLVQLLPGDQLVSLGVGEIRYRSSSCRPEGHLSNGCRVCATVMGEFYLQEAITEYLSEGGDYTRLILMTVELPLACIPTLEDWDDDDDDLDLPIPS